MNQYAYTQDLTKAHHVYIQEEPSTLYINSGYTFTENIYDPIVVNADYTFTEDIYDPIVVDADNIVIDGNGFTLQGLGTGAGFHLEGRSNITIMNVMITEWKMVIHLLKLKKTNSDLKQKRISIDSKPMPNGKKRSKS